MRLAKWLVALGLAAGTMAACSSDDESGDDLFGSGGAGGDGGGGGNAADGGASGAGASGGGAAAGSGGGATDAGTDVSAGGVGGGSADAGGDVVRPPVINCGLAGDDCLTGSDCCSSLCDSATGSCQSSVTACADNGASCTSPLDCCSNSCRGGSCVADACIPDGDSCSANDECCGQTCNAGTCEPINPGAGCKSAGNTCSGDGECCSGLCESGTCELRASFCVQEDDICSSAAQCCTGRCDIADGATVGVCGPPPKGSTFCSDGVEGSLCNSCNDCCSRLCAPFGPTGVMICQPASGCHVTGDFCRSDTDCCGGDPDNGLPGAGNVECQFEGDSVLGVCRNPRSCSPQGNVCHFKDYACGVSSARNNCCAGTGNSGVCKLDPLGVPRCDGLGDECRQPGETCASADDCCFDYPCIPDSQGVLRCLQPPNDSGDVCVPVTGACTINADCCPGNTCVRPVGSTQGTCNGTLPPPPTDGGTPPDSGTPPPPVCSQYGQQCSSDGDCCNQIPCNGGICRILN